MAYTTIDNPQEYFQTFDYTGDGTTAAGKTRTFDGSVDLKPGLMYQFKFTASGNRINIMENEYTGAGTHWLASSGDSVANDGPSASFDTNGFTHATQNLGGYYHNENNSQYGIWAWKDMDASNATNTSGTITSTVRADTTMGLSYVNWTGTSADGTLGHGLGTLPDAIWMYPIQVAANNGNTQRPQWWRGLSWNHVFNTGLNEGRGESDSTNGRIGAYSHSNSQGTTSVFSVFSGNSSYEAVNHSSQNYLALVWSKRQGFSHFSSYEGTGENDGQFVYCGFKPELILIKKTENTDGRCFDGRRNPTNLTGGKQSASLNANFGLVADDNTRIDILSNGFKLRTNNTSMNQYNKTYCFAAFAAEPLVTSTGVPATAR